MIWESEQKAREIYGEDVPFSMHPVIRSADACLKSSQFAVNLASHYDALLHVLHLTTAIEMNLFNSNHRSKVSCSLLKLHQGYQCFPPKSSLCLLIFLVLFELYCSLA